MIQSGKFDSFMNFKNNIEKIRNFLFERLIEFFGVLLLISGFLILLSLISYNPNDPNSKSSNWYISANALVFTDGIKLLR